MTKDSPFISHDGKPRLIECAVLFFDLLGVSAMAQGSKAKSELLRFNATIRDAFPYAIGAAAAKDDRSAYPASVFSDSVVAAVPISRGLPAALAIFQLAFDVAQLQTELAERDYFARGAITLDKFHCYDGLLFGPALVEAVALEREVAVDPRIVLSPAATAAVIRASKVPGEGDFYDEIPVLVDEDGLPFVNYLGGAFKADPEIDLPEKLRVHRDSVAAQLERQVTNFPRWTKHRWVAEFHNATCAAYSDVLSAHGGYESFLVDSIHTERPFRSLL